MNCSKCNLHTKQKNELMKSNKKLSDDLRFTYFWLALSIAINAVFVVRFL